MFGMRGVLRDKNFCCREGAASPCTIVFVRGCGGSLGRTGTAFQLSKRYYALREPLPFCASPFATARSHPFETSPDRLISFRPISVLSSASKEGHSAGAFYPRFPGADTFVKVQPSPSSRQNIARSAPAIFVNGARLEI